MYFVSDATERVYSLYCEYIKASYALFECLSVAHSVSVSHYGNMAFHKNLSPSYACIIYRTIKGAVPVTSRSTKRDTGYAWK